MLTISELIPGLDYTKHRQGSLTMVLLSEEITNENNKILLLSSLGTKQTPMYRP